MLSRVLAHFSLALGLTAALGTPVEAQTPAGSFVERPGELEFSGRMIVRIARTEVLADRDLSRSQVEAVQKRAADRLAAWTLEFIPETDEYIVRLPPGETENGFSVRLMETGDYAYAEPDWICHPIRTVPNDSGYSQQWHHQKIQSAEAWDLTTGSPSLIIANVDSGINLTHPDLMAALVPGYNAATDTSQADGGDVSDVDGHGTYVAGIDAAIGNNGIYVVGIGWNFSCMPVRYYNTPGGGYLSNLLRGARWAADNGARCVSVSQTGVEYSTVQTTGAYVRARDSLMFYAAGNDSRNLNWFDWPDVIVVGATDGNDNLASFSAFGPAVDVVAPGVNILSTGIEGGLAVGSGTSASTPIAAGICALVWSKWPALDSYAVEQLLYDGCFDLGTPGDDDVFGYGRVDSFNSVSAPLVCQTDIGFGGPGDAVLTVCGGDLSSGTTADLELTNGYLYGRAFIQVGPSNNPVAFKGGLLVPNPGVTVGPIQMDNAGELTVPGIQGGGTGTWYVQVFHEDFSVPSPYVGLSNAVQVQFLP